MPRRPSATLLRPMSLARDARREWPTRRPSVAAQPDSRLSRYGFGEGSLSLKKKLPHVGDAPPQYSAEAEQAYLAGILRHPDFAGSDVDLLNPNDFFVDDYREIFTKMVHLDALGMPMNDAVLLLDSLSPEGKTKLGPVIAGLLDPLHAAGNLAHYAGIIKRKRVLRNHIALCADLGNRLAAANGDAAEVLREVSALSAPLREEVGQKRILGFKTGLDLASEVAQEIVWIARGLVAKGSITELGAKVKTGKTTLIMAMVEAVVDGLTFLGQPTFRTPVVYLTEQPPVSFREAMQRARLLGRKDFAVLSFTETRNVEWPQVAAAAAAECKNIGASLLVVDTLSQFARLTGDRENNSGDALEAMQPLQQAASDGIGVVLVRHERKSGGDVGDSGRGSSAFAGAVDIVLSLRKSEGNSGKNRRVLQSLSRFSETPNDLVIELTDGGYIAIGERRETTLKDGKDSIFRTAPEGESNALDLQALALAADQTRQTAQRAIEELVRDGMLIRIGKGKRGDPFRYFIPEKPFCPTSHIERAEKQKQQNLNLSAPERVPYRDSE